MQENQSPDLLKSIHFYATAFHCALGFLLAATLLTAFKFSRVARLAIYVEFLLCVATAFTTVETDPDTTILYFSIVITINFVLCYFNWWSGYITSALSLLPCYIARMVYYDEPTGVIVSSFIAQYIILTINLIFCHLTITKVGMIYVESEVLRKGSDQLL